MTDIYGVKGSDETSNANCINLMIKRLFLSSNQD